MHTQFESQWDIYTAAWKATTGTEKHALFEKCLAPHCIYRDPLTVTEGWDALASYMLDFHKLIPGGHFVTRDFKAHNNRSIAQWDMCTGGGSVIGKGISYAEYNSAGQLTCMNGFFDPPDAG